MAEDRLRIGQFEAYINSLSLTQTEKDEIIAPIDSGEFSIELNQNSEGAPYIPELAAYDIDWDAAFSDGQDSTVKTGKTTQERWYVESFVGQTIANEDPTDIQLTPSAITLDNSGNLSADLMFTGALSATDADSDPANFVFSIVGQSEPDKFNLAGNVLSSDGGLTSNTSYWIDVKVEDGEGGSYTERFTIQTGSDQQAPSSGQATSDTLNGTEAPNAADDVIYGNGGGDFIYGLGGDDTLFGMAGDDQLFGGVGDDTLYGGLRNDTLDGGAGHNTLWGGEGDGANGGNDTFVIRNYADSSNTIMDFDPQNATQTSDKTRSL